MRQRLDDHKIYKDKWVFYTNYCNRDTWVTLEGDDPDLLCHKFCELLGLTNMSVALFGRVMASLKWKFTVSRIYYE